jgi:hypothetical protein
LIRIETGITLLCLGEEGERVETQPHGPMPPPAPPGIEDGIHKMPKADYHADPCVRPSLSNSIALILNTDSPAHAWLAHPRGGGVHRAGTAAMDLGSVIDSMLLGGDTEIVTVDAADWKTKAAKAARLEAQLAGKVAVLQAVHERAARAADIIRAKLISLGILLDGENQVTIVWSEEARNGQRFQCRGRLDHLSKDGLTVFDLKVTAKANPIGPSLGRHCVDFGYDIQGHAYLRGIEKLDPARAGRMEFVNIFVEAKPPYAIAITEPDGMMRELGARRWDHAVNKWGVGLATGYWHGYSEPGAPRFRLSPPPWTLDDSMGGGDFSPTSESLPF